MHDISLKLSIRELTEVKVGSQGQIPNEPESESAWRPNPKEPQTQGMMVISLFCANFAIHITKADPSHAGNMSTMKMLQ